MTLKEQDAIVESLLAIRKRIDKYEGRERHIFLIACRANIRLARLIKSKQQFAKLAEFEEYSRFVDEELDKSAAPLPTVITSALRIQP